MKRLILAISALLLSACNFGDGVTAPEPEDAGPARLDVTLSPHSAEGVVKGIDVELKLEAPDIAAQAPFLQMAMVFANTETARYEARDLQVTDDQGVVPLTQIDDPVDPNNSVYYRRWRPQRQTVGDVAVRWSAPERLFGPRRTTGPPFNLLQQDGGFSGAGMAFMVTPETEHPYRIALRWNMSAMPPGSRGAWSMGAGDVDTVGPADFLSAAYFMAGPDLHAYPASGDDGFAIYWMGDPSFDVDAIGAWITRAYAAMSSFFHSADQPFRVFLRMAANSSNGGGGAGLINSFMAGYGEHEQVSVEGMRGLLAHEMAHNWPRGVEGPVGESSWYAEGMAEHYSRLLTFRAGLLTPEEYIESANSQARAYYTNPLNRLPAKEIAALFWRDANARTLPYGRGAIYLAQLDGQIRTRSNDQRSLDDLTLAMIERDETNPPASTAVWIELLRAELGESAVTEFEAMMRGELLSPPSNAFGPCFRRIEVTLRRIDLGFSPNSLSVAGPRIIAGVDPGSHAVRAGVRNGDEVVEITLPESTDSNPVVEMRVRRDGRLLDFQYSADAGPVPGFQWEPIPGLSDAACNVWGVLPRP